MRLSRTIRSRKTRPQRPARATRPRVPPGLPAQPGGRRPEVVGGAGQAVRPPLQVVEAPGPLPQPPGVVLQRGPDLLHPQLHPGRDAALSQAGCGGGRITHRSGSPPPDRRGPRSSSLRTAIRSTLVLGKRFVFEASFSPQFQFVVAGGGRSTQEAFLRRRRVSVTVSLFHTTETF